MRNKISFFILNNTGSLFKQVTTSTAFLRFVGLTTTICLIVLGVVVFDYYKLKRTASRSHQLKNQLSFQQDEIINQRKQIQRLADAINNLKTKLVALNDFERKIRIIANIEKPADENGLIGVGGSIHEDLDLAIPLSKKHNSLLREMHEQSGQLKLASINQEEGFSSLLKYLEDQRNLLASTPAIRPTKGWVASKFGYRKSPFTGLREFHKGLDIATRKGTPILATADGVVTFTGRKGFLGKVVVIDHGYGMVSRYGHAQTISVKRGDAVKRGDTIAQVGSTGRSTGSHVHYEVILKGIPVNPERYILN